MIILDLGCGKIKQDARAIGLDRERGSAADVLCDLRRFPWPLADSCADTIHLSHFIEHQPDLLRLMAEIRRVGKPGAEVIITTPHFSSHGSYTDPTHLFHLGYRSFEYFAEESFENFTYNSGGFKIIHRELTFGKNFLLDNAGKFFARCSIDFYEKHLAWMFPARNIVCRLKVVK